MTKRSNAILTTENNTIVVTITTPEGITPTTLGTLLQDIIDSMWNKTDDLLTPPPVSMNKATLATAIGASTLIPFQWIQITNRADSNPLWVQAVTVNTISPFGIWIVAGKPCLVVMDYANGYEGETYPFVSAFDTNRKFSLNKVTGQDNYSISTILNMTDTLTWTGVLAAGYADQTITINGAAVGDPVILGIDPAAMAGGAVSFIAFVSATNTVTVRFINHTAGTLSPSGDFAVTIIK